MFGMSGFPTRQGLKQSTTRTVGIGKKHPSKIFHVTKHMRVVVKSNTSLTHGKYGI